MTKVAHRFAIAALFFAFSMPGRATSPAEPTRVARMGAPAWIKPQIPDLTMPVKSGQTGNGTRDLLIDEQVNARENADYIHYAIQFLSQNGVEENSRLTFTFDPSCQTLVLNKLIVYRNGKASDRLAAQEVKLLHREEGLDRLLYDGRLSAVLILEDIRVGDIVEYAYTIRGANPIFDGHYFDSFSTLWDFPVDRVYHRLIWPAGHKLGVKSFGEDLQPTITPVGQNTEYVWEKKAIPALASDGDLPSSFDPYNWVQLSEFQSWSEVAHWACKLFTVQETDAGELREQVDAIKPIGDRKKEVVAALRFVQDNIRYLGIEVGAHSHKPYPIATVLQRRFGDCKDKALLLCALLRQLGFEAYPCLVETDYRKTIAEWLPTTLAFNHLVVQLRLDGHVYWLDPTRTNQGGTLDEIFFPDYGEALVIKEDTDSLTKITPQAFDAVKIEVTESYSFPDFTGKATLKVHTVTHGRNSDSTRGWLAETTPDDIKKDYLNFYAKQYPHIEMAAPPVFHDDLGKNEITIDESYKISQFWQPHSGNSTRLYADFYPQTLHGYIPEPDTLLRTMPYAIPHPTHVIQTILISLPNDRKLTAETKVIKDPVFRFSSERTVIPRQVTDRFEFETLADQVDAARTGEYVANINRVIDDLGYDIWISKDMAQSTTTPTPAAENGVKAAEASSSPAHDNGNASPFEAPLLLFGFLAGLGGGLYWFLQRRKQTAPVSPLTAQDSLHRCNFCGKTELTAPELDFRVSGDGEEYCHPHLPKPR
ncbi:MAG: DUF3857 domain-containing protein [Chthoniobacteraceae bacterium]